MTDRYLDYDSEQFALDAEVQAYALEGRNTEAWERWLREHPNSVGEFNLAVEELRALRGHFRQQSAETALAAQSERVWRSVSAEIDRRATPRARKASGTRRRRLALAAASILLLAVVVFQVVAPGVERYETVAGQQLTVALPDGSAVALAPLSTLTVHEFDGTRRLELTGDAFFEVEKGTPFSVETGNGEVTVLGTSFEVRSRTSSLAVACATGKVRVARLDQSAILTPGLRVQSTTSGLAEVQPISPQAIASWRAGVLSFAASPLTEVAATLGRYYDKRVDIAASADERTLTATLPTDDFAKAVEQLGFILQTPIDTSDGRLRIR